MRTEKLSPEIERSIADAHSLADQIEAAASSEERCRLADLLCKKVDETIGMIVRADAVSVSPKRQRKPTLASALKQANKECRAVSGATLAPDGSVSLTFGESNTEPQGDLDKWLAKRHAN